MSFPRYLKYKPSGVEWLRDVPEHWAIKPLYSCAEERNENNKGMIENNLLSLSYGKIVRKDISSNDGLLPESFETYQIVRRGDIVFRPTDLQNDWNSLRSAIVEETGIITSAYIATKPNGPTPKYLHYLFRVYDTMKVFYSMGGGLRQSMKYSDLKRLPVIVPPITEQTAIAAFLDRETAKIDALVTEQQRLMELLKEKRQAVISHAVTKGLNPKAPMKPSGIEWLGDVPEHWTVQRVKSLTNILRGKFTHRPRHDPAMYDGPYPFIQTGEINQANRFVGQYHQTLSEAGFQQSKQFPKGTLVMTITGAGTANVAILDYEACFPDSIVGFVPKNGMALDYLYNLFVAMRQALLETSVTNTQPNLNIERIGALLAVQPPLHEQADIIARIDKVSANYEGLIIEAQHAIDLLQERRTALISAAVTGQIDVRSFAKKEAA
ncbi:MAG: restriction endonuclease subunit S [Verrucomicrobiales bacterium]|nr:restriction endonuclease subunit S [Verrucomicrobiales bacterium]